MKWQADVWRFTFMGKSRSGNWYEGQFRWFWMAKLAARFMALMCDIATPKKLYFTYDVRGGGTTVEEQDSPYGIAWGVKKLGAENE